MTTKRLQKPTHGGTKIYALKLRTYKTNFDQTSNISDMGCLVQTIIDILKWILFFSGFNFSDKDFPYGFATLSLPTAAHQFHTSVMKIKVMLLATLLHDRCSLICSIGDTNIRKRIPYFSGFNLPPGFSLPSSTAGHQFYTNFILF